MLLIGLGLIGLIGLFIILAIVYYFNVILLSMCDFQSKIEKWVVKSFKSSILIM